MDTFYFFLVDSVLTLSTMSWSSPLCCASCFLFTLNCVQLADVPLFSCVYSLFLIKPEWVKRRNDIHPFVFFILCFWIFLTLVSVVPISLYICHSRGLDRTREASSPLSGGTSIVDIPRWSSIPIRHITHWSYSTFSMSRWMARIKSICVFGNDYV